MGDRRRRALRVPFDGKLKFEFHGALDHERDLPAGTQVNPFETEILTGLKEPEVLDGRAGKVD